MLSDQRGLLAEIERDVREQRRNGAITPEYEAELDGAFAAVAPPGFVGGGFDSVVDQAARHAIVDFDAPIVGNRPLRFVKRTVKLLTAWYIIFVGRQLVAFAGTTLRALRMLGRRVDRLERRIPGMDPGVQAMPSAVASDRPIVEWVGICRGVFGHTALPGLVLHADCGDGALLSALVASDIDGYGIDARADAGEVADAQDVEVRRIDTLTHLEALAPGSLRGIVLAHCVDRLPLGDQLQLIASSTAAVHADGAIVLIGQRPDGYLNSADRVAGDLAPGRPLHPETWLHLLHQCNWLQTECHVGHRALPDGLTEGGDPAIAALIERVFPANSYCIVARRV